MSSFIDTESVYANIFNSDAVSDMFIARIKTLVLGTKYHKNKLVLNFWNTIESYKDKDNKITYSNYEKKIKKYVKGLLPDIQQKYGNELSNRNKYKCMEPYEREREISKEVNKYLKIYKKSIRELLVYIFKVGYFIKNKIENDAAKLTVQDDSQFCSEESRAKLYQSFTEAMHGIGRCNLRSIYIEEVASVIKWKYKLKTKKKIRLKITQQSIRVCHLDYAGIVSLLPIENSEYIK